MSPKTLKKIPIFETDEEAEHFVDTADLTEYDLSGFKPMAFIFEPANHEFKPKTAAIHMRLPESLLKSVKACAKSQGIPYTRYIRSLLERDIARRERQKV